MAQDENADAFIEYSYAKQSREFTVYTQKYVYKLRSENLYAAERMCHKYKLGPVKYKTIVGFKIHNTDTCTMLEFIFRDPQCKVLIGFSGRGNDITIRRALRPPNRRSSLPSLVFVHIF